MQAPPQYQGPSGLQGQGPQGTQGLRGGETASDLRRQIHEMKVRDRQALAAGANAGTPVQKFMMSQWFTAGLTSVAVFLLLYITNPLFVHEPNGERYAVPRPSVKRVTAWAILAGLIVALGPFLVQKVSAAQ